MPRPDLPPWSSSIPGKKRAFVEWTHRKLDEHFKRLMEMSEDDGVDVLLELAKMCADQNDATALHFFYPEIADYIHPLKLKQGQKRTDRRARRLRELTIPEIAAETVPIVRKIWREHYGKVNRSHDDGNSAVEIVALYYGVKQHEVESRLKKMKRSTS
jgi:hypothetical protein